MRKSWSCRIPLYSSVLFQNIIAGVGVSPKVFHCQQTMLQFEFLGDPKRMHIEVAQLPEIVRPHIGGERNGRGTYRSIQGISKLGLHLLSFRQAMVLH